jgi:hypothetical protein
MDDVYERKRTTALIDEAQRLTAGLKLEMKEIKTLIDNAFEEDGTGSDTEMDDETKPSRSKFKWWFWR